MIQGLEWWIEHQKVSEATSEVERVGAGLMGQQIRLNRLQVDVPWKLHSS